MSSMRCINAEKGCSSIGKVTATPISPTDSVIGNPIAKIARWNGAAWSGFAPRLEQWLAVTEGTGPESVKQAYLDTLNGRVPPKQGHILSLTE